MQVFGRKSDDPWKVYEEEIPSRSLRYKGLGVNLQDELRLEHLQLLWQRFSRPLTCATDTGAPVRTTRSHGEPVTPHPEPPRGAAKRGAGQGRSPGGSMGLEEFRAVLRTLPGSEAWVSEMEELFDEVDTSCEGRIGWEQFCSYILQGALQRPTEGQAGGDALTSQPVIRHCPHNKQEPVIRVVHVSQPPPLRFITISKGGVLSVWNRHLHLISSLELVGDPIEGGHMRGKFKGWTTDAVFLPNVHKMAVATLGRELRFFDISTSNYTEELHLFGLSNAVTSMCYWYDTKSPADRSVLLWGDEKGFVHLLWFLQPLKGLFEIPFSNQKGPHRLYLPDLCPNSPLVTYQQLSRVHQEPINRIKYESQGELIMTSSESATSSVVIMDLNMRRKSYIWKINKGVTSFDFCPALSLLVTCGLDPAVRLWNRYVPSRPVATLLGHNTTVLDVAVHQRLNFIFSYSRDAVLKIWDIPSQRCVRTLQLRFPCVKAGLSPEYGHFPFLLHHAAQPSASMLLLTCKDYLACLHLQGKSTDDTPASVTCAVYNPHLGQVVTARADSSLAVWDVATGRRTLEVRHAHGEEEITCVALHHTHRHLLTGASNGTIKMWDLLNGHNLHKMEAVSDTEVTGIICFPGNRLLAVGWSQQIAKYIIADPNDVYVRADVSWKSGRQHRDDVLAAAHCPARKLLATGSFDGEVIIWTLDTERPLARLHSDQGQAPVDALLFLQGRAQSGPWGGRPLLLSSQAGHVCWWSTTGPPHCHGRFYAPQQAGECVLALSSSQDDRLLLTGDTAGLLQVWDVSQYCLDHTDPGPTDERPPLLHCLRAHDGPLVWVEFVEPRPPGVLHMLSVSADGAARLWTGRGDAVGTFGQEGGWTLGDVSTYQCSREDWSKQVSGASLNEEEEEGEEEELGDSQSVGRTDGPEASVQVQRAAMTDQAQRLDQERRSQNATVEGKVPDAGKLPTGLDISVQSHLEFKDRCISPAAQDPLKVSPVSHVVGQLQRRMASWQTRRQTFGRIDPKKLSLIDNICAPFQALIMPEMSPVSEAPRRPEMLDEVLRFSRFSSGFSRSTTLSSPLLSSCSPETTSAQEHDPELPSPVQLQPRDHVCPGARP
ncbi:WD repeat-containing protein on Y chromosome [Sardina pilchardus]|uniref:WD repeat-containing protein on Y chromosome n=1 Tax=Sardina pilchardus TaxID=27697 RepID=UPI002E0DBEEE